MSTTLVQELFSEMGHLKHCAVHYDSNRRPTGSAEVIFTRRSEALQALKRYNNVRLDGKPMKIEVIGADTGLSAASATRVSVVPGARGRGQREVVMMPGTSGVGRGGSVEVLLKEGEEKGVVVLVAVGVALVRGVGVGMGVAIMCERHLWKNQRNNWTRSLTTTILVR
ncbi:hypothetical protein PR202_gb17306 [Eleusine coracana subsp. coracana]|uniref:RRM domain-containing protein n=1 Tax=Eleusine coracana subsp. coracana TaxID=191504 RepID=A0AAV5F080_ELECO|nr:hypothetical protein PR202_gb17306 [Eleusine coracana subsp. coracana]